MHVSFSFNGKEVVSVNLEWVVVLFVLGFVMIDCFCSSEQTQTFKTQTRIDTKSDMKIVACFSNTDCTLVYQDAVCVSEPNSVVGACYWHGALMNSRVLFCNPLRDTQTEELADSAQDEELDMCHIQENSEFGTCSIYDDEDDNDSHPVGEEVPCDESTDEDVCEDPDRCPT